MKNIRKQSKEMKLRRTSGDKFEFMIEVGAYYIDNKEVGVFINVAGSFLLFDSYEEYWNSNLDVLFWEDILYHTVHDPITDLEATALTHVVEALRKETETGVNQLYLDDETIIDGVFDIVAE